MIAPGARVRVYLACGVTDMATADVCRKHGIREQTF